MPKSDYTIHTQNGNRTIAKDGLNYMMVEMTLDDCLTICKSESESDCKYAVHSESGYCHLFKEYGCSVNINSDMIEDHMTTVYEMKK